MKMPKVSGVFEGRRGRRGRRGYLRTQEEINESRLARINARARRFMHLQNTTINNIIPSFTNPQNPFITQSMSNINNMIPFLENNTLFPLNQQPLPSQLPPPPPPPLPQEEMGLNTFEIYKLATNQDFAGVDHGVNFENPNPSGNGAVNNNVMHTNIDCVTGDDYVIRDNPNLIGKHVLERNFIKKNECYISVDDDVAFDNSNPKYIGMLNNIDHLEPPSDEIKKPIFDATFARMDNVEGKGEWWEEWPFKFSYEEELMWTMNANDLNSVMASGEEINVDSQDPLHDEQLWTVDLWNIGDNNFPRID